MDTKFSVALHILAFIAETKETATSQLLAESVHTNSSHIRKITASLKQAGLIASQQGKSGMTLTRPAEEISLDQVYEALYPDREILHVHEDANPACPVGAHIKESVQPIFNQAQAAFMQTLASQSLADVVANLYKAAKPKNN